MRQPDRIELPNVQRLHPILSELRRGVFATIRCRVPGCGSLPPLQLADHWHHRRCRRRRWRAYCVVQCSRVIWPTPDRCVQGRARLGQAPRAGRGAIPAPRLWCVVLRVPERRADSSDQLAPGRGLASRISFGAQEGLLLYQWIPRGGDAGCRSSGGRARGPVHAARGRVVRVRCDRQD